VQFLDVIYIYKIDNIHAFICQECIRAACDSEGMMVVVQGAQVKVYSIRVVDETASQDHDPAAATFASLSRYLLWSRALSMQIEGTTYRVKRVPPHIPPTSTRGKWLVLVAARIQADFITLRHIHAIPFVPAAVVATSHKKGDFEPLSGVTDMGTPIFALSWQPESRQSPLYIPPSPHTARHVPGLAARKGRLPLSPEAYHPPECLLHLLLHENSFAPHSF